MATCTTPNSRSGQLGWLIGLFLFILASKAAAVSVPYPFADPAKEADYRRLLLEIRCVVCQNQSLLDSNAPLAEDLRQEVYQMYVAGNSERAIKRFLVQHYGVSVLYAPPVQATTWFLWFAPLVLLGLVLASWLWYQKKS